MASNRLVRFAVAISAFATCAGAQALLVATVQLDTPTQLWVTWTWNGFPNTDSNTPTLTNWALTLETDNFGVDNIYRFVNVQHIVNPHQGEALPAPFTTPWMNAEPIEGSFTNTVGHPGGNDVDQYAGKSVHNVPPLAHFEITAMHAVPEPASMVALAAGAMGLLTRRRSLRG